MKSPGQKTNGIARRFARILLAIFVSVFLFAPKQAHAQSLSDLLAALSGSTAALQADFGLTSPPPAPFNVAPYDTAWQMGTIVSVIQTTVGKYVDPTCDTGFPAPTCLSIALSTVNGAISGNAADLSVLQNTIGGTFWENYIATNYVPIDYYGDGSLYVPYYMFSGTPAPYGTGTLPDVNGRFLPNPMSTSTSWLLSGAGNQATQTLMAAMGCSGSADAGALNTLNELFYNPDPTTGLGGGSSTTFLQAMSSGLGTSGCTPVPPPTPPPAWNSGTSYVVNSQVSFGGNTYKAIAASTNITPPNASYWSVNPPPGPSCLSSACNTLTLALGGDTNANSAINLVIASILYTNQLLLPATYNAGGVNYLMQVPVTPTGLTGSPPSILVNPPPPAPPSGPVPIPPPPAPIPLPPIPPGPPAPPLPPSPPTPPAPPATPVPGPLPTPPTVGQAGPVEDAAPTNGCTSGNPALTNTFGYNNGDPCIDTEEILKMTNDTTYWDVAGTQFIQHVNDWFDNQMLPAMKDMTAQLSASVIDQSRQMGTAMDSHNMSKSARVLQDTELEEKKKLQPNERSCVPASSVHAQAQTMTSSNALEAGFRRTGTLRTGNAPSQPGATTPQNDQLSRWNEFCTYFLDTQSNAGWNACPGLAPSAAASDQIKNGDIDVEGVLLVDTIDLKKKGQYHAIQTIMQNLVQPRVWEQLPDSVVETPAGQAQLLRREHIKAIQNIVYDVIGGIISRRASIPMSGNSVASKIWEIRERASVPKTRGAGSGDPAAPTEPSYNEIMLALTKERFFDPDYYTRMANDLGALKQEQTTINAYSTLTLQDIYKLQEQINALLAARAAMKLEKEPVAGPSVDVVPTR